MFAQTHSFICSFLPFILILCFSRIFLFHVYGFIYPRSSPFFSFFSFRAAFRLFFIYPFSLYLYSPYIFSIYLSPQSFFRNPYSLLAQVCWKSFFFLSFIHLLVQKGEGLAVCRYFRLHMKFFFFFFFLR